MAAISLKSSLNAPDVYTPRDYDGDKYILALTRHTRAFWVSVLVALACNLGLLLGGLEWMGNYGLIAGVDNSMLTRVLLSTLLSIVGLVLGPLSIGFVYILGGRTADITGRVFIASIVAAFAAGCVVAVALAFTQLMQMDAFYNAVLPINYNSQFFGGVIIVLYTLLAASGICVSCLILCRRPSARHTALAFTQPMQPTQLLPRALRAAGAFLLFGLVFFLTTILPCIWNGTDGASSLSGYFQTPSPVSLITTMWTFNPSWKNGNFIHDLFLWNGQLYLKLFPDVCVFFGMLLGLALLAVVGTLIPAVRRMLHKRLRLPSSRALPTPVHKWLRQWETGVTVGEGIIIAAVAALYGYWIWYWYAGNNRITTTAVNVYGDPNANLQIAARVVGHVTNLSMSLLILPVARNSVWEAIFGMPFERFIKYHRVLGRVAWTSATLHMLLWQVKWLMEGNLRNNVVTVSNLIISPSTLGPDIVHQDNWTIPLAEAGWLVLTIALIATFVRRAHYEVFQYAHHAVWFFMFTSLLHSWGLWYYLVGGAFLAIVDKLMRTIKASRPVKIVSITTVGNVTRLAVDADIFKNGGYYAGQYAFINIPAISLLQWHPYTISSAPTTAFTERVITFHVKAHTPGSWSHELSNLAAAAPHPGDISMSIDGPYGRTGHYFERDTLVLVAGGIGITPLHSVLQDVYTRIAEPDVYPMAGARVRHVVLVWTCKEATLFATFADTIATILRSKHRAAFSFHLHYTGSMQSTVTDALQAAAAAEGGMCDPGSAATVAGIITPGRPNLEAIISRALTGATSHASGAPSDVLTTMVCGPESLVEDASDASFKLGVDFHSEIFHF